MQPPNNDAMDPAKRYLDLAARLAWRGRGLVEPNPMVGAVLVKDGRVIGLGHHHFCGGPHAEVEAIEDCRRAGEDPSGATMYVTLEPCNHAGKTPPCTRAVIHAGITRTVIAREDPNPAAAGGAAFLRDAGVKVEFSAASPAAQRISDPFIKRTLTGLPWTIAKWAQTADGRLTTSAEESRWISCAASRNRVHRLRGRCDAILTGIGTILADDPLLTVRGTRARRTPLRVVLDPRLRIPIESNLVRTAADVPVLVCRAGSGDARITDSIQALRSRGVEVAPFPESGPGLDLGTVLAHLSQHRNVSTVLVEAGSRLLASLFAARLVDEAIVFVAPREPPSASAGDRAASQPLLARGGGGNMALVREGRCGTDAMLCYRRADHQPAPAGLHSPR